jgi:predicted transcriptional regulator
MAPPATVARTSKTRQYTVHIDPGLATRIAVLAAQQGRRKSHVFAQALSQFLVTAERAAKRGAR